MDSLHFTDLWRLFYPLDSEYTFYSTPHKVFTRIDYIFGTDTVIPLISETEIHEIAISDHAPVSISVNDMISKSNPQLWRFPSYLHNNADFQVYMDKAWREFATANSSHADNSNLYWDAGKAYLGGRVISYAASCKKHTLSSYKTASSSFKQAQLALSAQDSPENRGIWRKAKNYFDTWADILELTKWALADAKLYNVSNKSSKLLARLCKGPYKPTHITTLRDPSGTIKKTPQEVSSIIQSFYSSLYATDPIDHSLAHKFLDKFKLPSITPSQLETLNEPISTTEISTAINQLALGKALGPNGFSGEFYKTLHKTFEPILLNVYNYIWKGGLYLPSGNQAIIKLILKKGKDPLDPGSYRPISLLNLDVKFFSKIITTRLANIIPSLIHPAQSGFVKGRTAKHPQDTAGVRSCDKIPGWGFCYYHSGRGESFWQRQLRLALFSPVKAGPHGSI